MISWRRNNGVRRRCRSDVTSRKKDKVMGSPAINMIPGETMGGPDACKTPPFGEPIPYPNMSESTMTDPATAALLVYVAGSPGLVEMSEMMMSEGDDGGVMGGIVSEMFIGPVEVELASVTVIFGVMGSAVLGCMTGHNGEGVENMPVGAIIAPSPSTVFCNL